MQVKEGRKNRSFSPGNFAPGHLADYAMVLRLCIYRLFGYARRHSCSRFPSMKYLSKRAAQSGKLGWLFLWLLESQFRFYCSST